VIIAADAVDSMDGEEMHRFALRLMAAAIGWPLGTEDILTALGA
jgi:nicotinamidase-related amidase